MKIISPDQLVAMDDFADEFPIHIDVAYARPDNTLFGEAIYRPEARLWLYKDLADIVLKASVLCYERHGCSFVLYDGLRTVDAQEKMLHTQRVLDNPHWLEEPRLLSTPGAGGHPRGMAVDIELLDGQGRVLDMGTPFDYLAESSDPQVNPAHRAYVHLEAHVVKNRAMLTDAMMDAAEALGIPLVPLAEEWWDFRLPADVVNAYAPLSDTDLPAEMQVAKAPHSD